MSRSSILHKRSQQKLQVSLALVVIMNIEQPLKRFLSFIFEDTKESPDFGDLIEELDYLVCSTYIPEFEYDDKEYPEPPEKNYQEIRGAITRRFPKLGFYCTVDADPSTIENAEILTGDAVDDLTDIVSDLLEVKWLLENTSINNALWHFQFTYRSHWGFHLRELQLFLHRQWW